jgi:hypothetical protein
MANSPLQFFRAGPPPPKVALLPDGLFFVRAVGIDSSNAPGGSLTPAEIASQVELALEAIAPFPLAQVYYGHFWLPGAGRALVFAAYRRRFAPELVEAWQGAELVMPAFAALLGVPVEPATTIVLASPEGLTALHWEDGPVPSQVRFRPLPAEVTDEDRAGARDELLRHFGSKQIVDLAGPPVAEGVRSDMETVFRCGDFISRLPAAAADALDVRDKEDLAHLRRERARSIFAWRALVGCFAVAGLLALGEILLAVGGLWQTTRLTRLHAQAPVVAEIVTAQSLADRINELANKQLLPMEMLGQIVGEKGERKPESIVFNRAATSGQNTITVEAQTGTIGDIDTYRNTLQALPSIAKVDFKPVRSANNIANFTFVVTFKPGALKPWEPPPAA